MSVREPLVPVHDDSAPLLPGADLKGRVAIVTGASAGLGHRIARVLDALSATVVVVARREDRLRELASQLQHGSWLAADLQSPGDVARVVPAVLERHQRVDVVVNNAGGAHIGSALNETLDTFTSTLQLNLVAPFVISQAAAADMRTRSSGSIVMVSSTAGIRQNRSVPQAAYVAAKSGLIGLTRELALQWSRYGVRVNAIAPGLFRTEANPILDQADVLDRWTNIIPSGRPGRGQDMDATVALLTTEAGSYVTGQVIAIDGGYSIE